MTDSDNDMKLLPLRGFGSRRRECPEQRSGPGNDRFLPSRELFLAKLRAGSHRDRSAVPRSLKYRRLQCSRQNFRVPAGIILCILALFASLSGWGDRVFHLRGGSSPTDQVQTQLAAGGEGYREIGQWVETLFNRHVEAQNLVLPEVTKDFVTREIGSLMQEFGAEEYSVPDEFVREVDRFIRQYQERDRELIVRAQEDERQTMDRVREILRNDQMPEDFAYMALVESGFIRSSTSQEGAAGFWQFTEVTAREYGLKVEPGVDERLDVTKSTKAASRYLRDLILDFGSGSSVMLAMAAYNSGREAVHRAVRNVKDPIKQRNFWYLYRTHALPTETREYVPKVFAAIIVGRNPEQLGF